MNPDFVDLLTALLRVGSLDVPFLGRAALLHNKRATGRLKDLADVEVLERSKPR